jgi:hypothetical protein
MEYELSFLNFDYKEIIKNLKKLGGKKNHGMIIFKIAYFYLPGKTNFNKGFIRVREEKDTVTMTTKITDSKYPMEYETSVNTTYENMINIISNAGIVLKIDTIKFREKWKIKGCNEVVFDIWPGLPLIMEVDCKTEEGLLNLCSKLELDHKLGFTQNKYVELYGFNSKITQNIPNLSFKNFKKLLKSHIIKNKKIFNSLNSNYYKSLLPEKYHNLL